MAFSLFMIYLVALIMPFDLLTYCCIVEVAQVTLMKKGSLAGDQTIMTMLAKVCVECFNSFNRMGFSTCRSCAISRNLGV